MKRLFFLTFLLLSACASAPPAKAPQWSKVPRVVLDAFCVRLRNEGVSRDSTMVVVKSTQPLITPGSLAALSNISPKGGTNLDLPTLADEINTTAQFLDLEIPTSGCSWRTIDAIDRKRDLDTMILQLSPPFVNPFVKSEAGLFARMSVGGDSPEWYWIPLAHKGEQLGVGHILPLSLYEE